MEFLLKRMNIESFKGIRQRTVDFDETFTRIMDKNGTGKTTIFSAFLWALGNVDAELRSNPAIFPIGVEECTPTVELICTANGKPIRIKKSQTRKITVVGSTQKVAMTNSFFFNDVPLSEADMKKRLMEYGVDLTNFVELVHPEAFLSGKKDEIRNLLFNMAGTYTDKDIADRMENVKEAADLLENYKYNEVVAMQKATLKKIDENYGKKGEILNSKIEGLEMSKVEEDYSALELMKNGLEEQIKQNQDKRAKNLQTQKAIEILNEKDMSLQFDISGLKNSVNGIKNEKCETMKKEVESLKTSLESKSDLYKSAYVDKETNLKMLESNRIDLDFVKKQLADTQALVFDTNTETCPTCGQRLPETDIAQLHKNFEDNKAKKIADYEKEIASREKQIADRAKKDKDFDARIETLKAEGKAIQEEYVKKRDAFQLYRDTPMDEDVTKDLVIKERELEEVRKKLTELKANYIPNVDIEEIELRAQMSDVDKRLGQAQINCGIDAKIEELRSQQAIYEQDRANAEKILYQLDMILKRKYELLTDEINKHFTLCNWSFFKQQKNGEWISTCECYVDGKELNSSVNRSMQMRAKVDICNTLQNYYDQHYPIFLDNCESLDSENQDALITDTQMVILGVKD